MSDIAVGIYGIIVLLALFLTGLEMAYCMILVGFVGFTFLMSFSAASNLVVKDFFDTFTTYSYTVIPLFIMMGELAQNFNIAKRLYVEFNASKRALVLLEEGRFLTPDEMVGARKVLGAAALTYVASTARAAVQLLRMFLLRSSRD